MVPKRGEIYLANLDPTIGSEQGKTRPVLVIQNDIFNEHGNIVIVAAISGRAHRGYLTDVLIKEGAIPGLTKECIVVGNQIRSIDKQRLLRYMGKLSDDLMKKVNEGLKMSLQLIDF